MTMPQRGLRGELIAALFLLGVVLFNKPLLNIFDAGATQMPLGIPLLYIYLFTAWGTLIALMAWAMEHRRRPGEPRIPPGEDR
jgi:hypothetical protein